MRNLTLNCVALLLLLLSAVNAKGQQVVKLSPDYERDSPQSSAESIVMNENWLALNGGGCVTWVQNRRTGQEYLFWLEVGSNSEVVEEIILVDDLLVAGGSKVYTSTGRQMRWGVIAFWDLNNLLEATNRFGNNEFTEYYHPQNWIVEEGLDRIFVNANRRLVGACDCETGLVSIYKILGDSDTPVQEIFVEDLLTCASSGDFLTLGRAGEVLLYKYNNDTEEYKHMASLDWDSPYWYRNADPDTIFYYHENVLGLTVSEDGSLYLLMNVANKAAHEVFKLDPKSFQILDRMYCDTMMYYDTMGIFVHEIYNTDGDFAIIGQGILHVPSARIIGSVVRHTIEGQVYATRSACLRDLGKKIEIVTAETLDSLSNGTRGYLCLYEEPVFTVSPPKKGRARGGTVELLTSSKVFRGGGAVFAVVADSGNRIRYTQEEGSSKKIIKKKTGGLIYKIKNIQSHTGLKKIKFSKANMEEYSVFAPWVNLFGRPVPDGEAKKWRYNLPVGNYAGMFVSPTPGRKPVMVEIRVKGEHNIIFINPAKF